MSIILGKGRCWDGKQILVIRGALMGVRRETLSAGNLRAVAWISRPWFLRLRPPIPELVNSGCVTHWGQGESSCFCCLQEAWRWAEKQPEYQVARVWPMEANLGCEL